MTLIPPLVLVLLLAPALALASNHRYSDDDDHVRAREAVRSGAALPFADILATLSPTFGGRVIEVELEREDGRLVYEITLVAPDGRVRELVVDAASGRVLEVEIDDDRDGD
ncbi:MAG: PepSY domain-containing protein [Salinarimonas sp.]